MPAPAAPAIAPLLAAALLPIAGAGSARSETELPATELPAASLPADQLAAEARGFLETHGCRPQPAAALEAPLGDAVSRLALAVALRNCLQHAQAGATDLQRRLVQQLAAELEALQGRASAGEARLGELQATRFAATTRLRGLTRSYLGGLRYSGNQIGPANTYRPGGQPLPLTLQDGVSFIVDVQLNLDTSFSGRDLFRARLRAGDGAYSAFRGNAITPLLRLDGVSPFCSLRSQLLRTCRNNVLRLDKLLYRTPLGSGFTLTLGPRLTQKDMLGLWPALYGSSERILSAFDYAGAVGAYSDVKGAGVGLHWRQPGSPRHAWVVSAVYAAGNGAEADPSQGGLLTAASEGAATLQLGYVGRNWNVAAVYTRNQAGARQDEIITPLSGETWPALKPGLGGLIHAYGLSGSWDPTPTRLDWLPAISAGWGFNRNVYNLSGPQAASPLLAAASQSWMLALEWRDVLDDGNNLGFAIGQPKHLTRFVNNSGVSGAFDSSWLMELWYRIQVSDALALTPALFWSPRPRGQLTEAGSSWSDAVLPTGSGASLRVFGAVLKATLRF